MGLKRQSGEIGAEKDGKDGKDGKEMMKLIKFEMPTSCISTSADAKLLMDLLPPVEFPGHRGCCFRGTRRPRPKAEGSKRYLMYNKRRSVTCYCYN